MTLPNFNTPWWDGFLNGLAVAWLIYCFNEYIVKSFRTAWKKTVREMKKAKADEAKRVL